MIRHDDINPAELRKQIRQKKITFGGNVKLKIFGKLNCKSGKRMFKQNRVFFCSEEEALERNFRPCGHCLI
ncbi:metal-binding protein [Lacihabitans soyangensis]|uniref:Metal-binding protein n=2 Tax=Lacihabitans soyangensis TaxID=869394 RepID=A0AAE3H3D2_9BACT|nr:metal-binding protein [Lacihabitans soyangensis]